MSYSEDLKKFQAAHKPEIMKVNGSTYRYVLDGKKTDSTLVFLNGGMNTLEMWMNYVDALGQDYQVLLFDYPQELKTNQELVVGMHEFFEKMQIKNPVFIGASDGGMVAQIYTQKYPKEVGGLVLVSTGGMDADTLKSLKKKYKDKKFAAGCSRDVIEKGAEMLGWELPTLWEKTIEAMRSCEADIAKTMETI